MKRWTIEEINELKIHVSNGLIYRDIGTILGRSTRSVQGKCNNLGITNSIHKNTKYTNSSYDAKLLERCNTIIRIGDYIDIKTPILHKCLICNKKHLSTPKDKFAGYGHCGNSLNSGGIPLNNTGTVYLVYIPKYDLYKFGITSKTTKERMHDGRIYNYELILERKFILGIDAMTLEKVWKENLAEYLINTGLLKSGNTETFRI